jgi:hypothetical protein
MAAENIILSEKYSDSLLPNTVVEMVEVLFGIVGNLVVLLVYTKYIQNKTVKRYFIPVLAVVDLVGCMSNAIYFYLHNTMQYVFPSVYLCKLLSLLRIMTGGLSAHLILVIALQRYLLICRPFGLQFTRKYCRVCILFFFVFSLGYSAPTLTFGDSRMITIGTGNDTQNISTSICGANRTEAVPFLGTLLFLSFLNIIVTCALYIPVTKTIYRKLSSSRQNRITNIPDANPNIETEGSESITMDTITGTRKTHKKVINNPEAYTKNDEQGKEMARKRFSIMLLAIIVVYVVSCLVSLAVHIYHFASGIKLSGYQLNIYLFCIRLNLLNHIANPYIYWFFDNKFRNELWRICCESIWKRS